MIPTLRHYEIRYLTYAGTQDHTQDWFRTSVCPNKQNDRTARAPRRRIDGDAASAEARGRDTANSNSLSVCWAANALWAVVELLTGEDGHVMSGCPRSMERCSFLSSNLMGRRIYFSSINILGERRAI